jgi:hypothetical protein
MPSYYMSKNAKLLMLMLILILHYTLTLVDSWQTQMFWGEISYHNRYGSLLYMPPFRVSTATGGSFKPLERLFFASSH